MVLWVFFFSVSPKASKIQQFLINSVDAHFPFFFLQIFLEMERAEEATFSYTLQCLLPHLTNYDQMYFCMTCF